MLDELQEMFRHGLRDTISLLADWRLYAGSGILSTAILAAILLGDRYDQEAVVLVLAVVAIAISATLSTLRWREQRGRPSADSG